VRKREGRSEERERKREGWSDTLNWLLMESSAHRVVEIQ
jgi:hypothetical protein